MNQYSISLGKVFGIPISIHWTFWILVLWIVYNGYSQGQSPLEVLWYLVFIFAIFFSIGLHELSHALAAKRFGIVTHSITFLPIGGVASLSQIPEDPTEELIITIAGPLVNLILAVSTAIFLSSNGMLTYFIENASKINSINNHNFLFLFLSVNLMLFLFNLIPALPMDGGRIFRSLMAYKIPYSLATKIAVRTAQIFAILFAFLGLLTNPFLIVLAIYVFISAQNEWSEVQSKEILDDYTATDIMMEKFTIFNEDDALLLAATEVIKSQEVTFLVKDEVSITGYFSKNDLIKGLSVCGKNAKLKYIMRINPIWVDYNMKAKEIWEYMIQEGIPMVLVGEQSNLMGVIDLENVKEVIEIHSSKKKFQKKEERLIKKDWALFS